MKELPFSSFSSFLPFFFCRLKKSGSIKYLPKSVLNVSTLEGPLKRAKVRI